MICPTCGNLLQKLTVNTNSGGKFDVDHCGRCGGTWFDPYEINRIPFHEVARIARLTVLPQNPTPEPASHKCPRCHRNLILSHYDIVPKNVRLLRCGKCHGIWATQRALTDFKKNQEETILEYTARKTAFPSLSVVFVPAILTLLLFMVTFTTVFSLQKSKESRINAQSAIINLTTLPVSDTSVNIIFQTKLPLKSVVNYGTDLFSMQTKTIKSEVSTHHMILLTDLKPKTLYTFTIILTDEKGRKITTGENSFITGEKN